MPVVEAWHTERGGMWIILGKNSSNKFEISVLGKKGTYVEGAEDMLVVRQGTRSGGYEDNFG
jgi:hypothetical protein